MSAYSNMDGIGYWCNQAPRVFTRHDVIASIAVTSSKGRGMQADPGGPDDTLKQVMLQTPSQFDCALIDAWKQAKDAGVLNYSVDDVLTKTLPGKYDIVVQLNPSRRSKRRAPFKFTELRHSFDGSAFNFTKIKPEELLFNLVLPGVGGNKLHGSLIVNTAPLCTTHCLLLPTPEKCRPQLIDDTGLQFAVTSVLLSGVRSFRVGFNSLCAYASVNHCHFHAYHLDRPLHIETAACRQVRGPCYTFVDHYAPGFVFQVTADDVEESIGSAMKLINHLTSAGIPHNVFITRGLPVASNNRGSTTDKRTVTGEERDACTTNGDLCSTDHETTRPAYIRPPSADVSHCETYDVLRLCVWARSSSVENCSDTAEFYSAVCELSGHVPVYSSDVWENIREEAITRDVSQACSTTFNVLLPAVEQLYT